MAREKVGDVVLKVRVSDAVLVRLDAHGGSRSELCRVAIEDWLERNISDAPLPVRDVRQEPEPPVVVEVLPVRTFVPARRGKRDWTGDFPAVEAAIREHRYSTRDLAKRLGWPEMRLDRVLEAMEAAGKVRYERGMVVAA